MFVHAANCKIKLMFLSMNEDVKMIRYNDITLTTVNICYAHKSVTFEIYVRAWVGGCVRACVRAYAIKLCVRVWLCKCVRVWSEGKRRRCNRELGLEWRHQYLPIHLKSVQLGLFEFVKRCPFAQWHHTCVFSDTVTFTSLNYCQWICSVLSYLIVVVLVLVNFK